MDALADVHGRPIDKHGEGPAVGFVAMVVGNEPVDKPVVGRVGEGNQEVTCLSVVPPRPPTFQPTQNRRSACQSRWVAQHTTTTR